MENYQLKTVLIVKTIVGTYVKLYSTDDKKNNLNNILLSSVEFRKLSRMTEKNPLWPLFFVRIHTKFHIHFFFE